MLDRYSTFQMRNIWSEKTKYMSWIEIEKSLLQLYVENNFLNKETYLKDPDPLKHTDAIMTRSKALEKIHRHDIEAFVRALREYMPNSKDYIHKGLTSSDVKDTTLAMALQESCDTIMEELEFILKVLHEKMVKYKNLPILGRTHGMVAQPMSLGLKFAGYYQMLKRCIERVKAAKHNIAFGKMSGAVGGCSFLTPKDELFILWDLDLHPEPIATQVVPRDRHAEVIMALAITAECIAKMATDIRLLHQSEIAEISECFFEDQKGSSAMPHKRNPIMCERLCGIARVVRGSVNTVLSNIALWNERDISHSSAERIIFPQAFNLTHYMINQMINIIRGLYVDTPKIARKIIKTAPQWSSQRLIDVLVSIGMDRTESYDIIQRESMKEGAVKKLVDRLMEHDGIKAIISIDRLRKKIIECFDYSYFLRHTDDLYERVAEKTVQDK